MNEQASNNDQVSNEHNQKRWIGRLRRVGLIGLALGVLLTMLQAAPASATGLVSVDEAKNIPAQGTCGPDSSGSYTKFTTGGAGDTGGNATSTGGSSLEATYAADSVDQSFQVLSVTDADGQAYLVSEVIGGAGSANPIWSFAAASSSPVLDVANDKNFSQFALCLIPIEDDPELEPTTTIVQESSVTTEVAAEEAAAPTTEAPAPTTTEAPAPTSTEAAAPTSTTAAPTPIPAAAPVATTVTAAPTSTTAAPAAPETFVGGVSVENTAVENAAAENSLVDAVVVDANDSLPITGSSYTFGLILIGVGMLALGISLTGSFRRQHS